jgi:translocation and assembly module TamB
MQRIMFILMLLLAGSLAWAQSEERAAPPSFLERQLQSLIPGLQVEGLEGAWRAAPSARRITLRDSQGVWLSAEDIRLSIAPTALLRGVLRLEGLEAARVTLDRLPMADPDAPAAPRPADAGVLPRLPNLPVDIALDRLAIGRLLLGAAVLGQAAEFTLDGRTRLGDGRLTAQLDLRRLDREGEARLDIALDPPRDQLTARVTIREAAGGLGPTLLGVAEFPLALDLALDGPAATGAALRLTGSLGPEIGIETSGTLRADAAGGLGATLEGTARAGPLLPPDLAPLASPARFALDATRPGEAAVLRLRRLDLALPAATLGVTGSLDLAREEPDLAISLVLAGSQRLGALVPAGISFAGVTAEARITGSLAAPRVALSAAPEALTTGLAEADALLGPAPRLAGWVALPGPALDLALDGAGARTAITGSLAEPMDLLLRLAVPDLAVLGGGSTGVLAAEARASGPRQDPTLMVTARSGRIAVAGRTLDGLDLSARIATPRSAPHAVIGLAAMLDQAPIRLTVTGTPEGASGFRLSRASLRIGDGLAEAELSGLLDTARLVFAGEARVAVRDLARLGRLGGVEGLAGRLTLAASLTDRAGRQGFDATLEAPLLGLDGHALAGIMARADGTPDAARFTLQGAGGGSLPLGRFGLRGGLEASPAGRRIELAMLEAQVAGEPIRLAGPARVVLGADGGVELGQAVLLIAQGGRLQASGRWGPERADLTARLTALPLALASRALPDIQPRGTLSGQLRITGSTARPEIRAVIEGQRLGAGAAWARGLPPLGLRANATLEGGGAAVAQATIEAGSAGRLTASARLPRGFGTGATIAATIDGGLDLGPLIASMLAGGADRVTGRVALALRAEGPLVAPQPSGRITLSGIAYRNAAAGLRVTDIGGVIAVAGPRLTLDGITGQAGGNGSIRLAGTLDPMAPGIGADLRLIARQARPVSSPYGTGSLDADLRLTGPLLTQGGLLAGRIAILGAELRIPETLPAATPVLTPIRTRGSPPPGVVPPPAPQPGPAPGAGLPPLGLDLTITTPAPIFVRGRGIDAELGGTLRLHGNLAAPIATGGLTLRRGSITILARMLRFERGRIDFAAGSLMPVLDLAAVARSRSATITVRVAGSPADPMITFSSAPELPQDEVLARLLFDRAAAQLSPFEIAQLAQAVGQLAGVNTGAEVLDTLRGALGLDRLGITTDAAGRAAVEAGRTVAPGVFLGVRQGVQGQTGVTVQLEITPHLRLEGQTATGPAGDRIGLSYETEY